MGKIVAETLYEFNNVFHAVEDGWTGVKSMSPTSVMRMKDKLMSLFDKKDNFNVGGSDLPQRFTVSGNNNDAKVDTTVNNYAQEEYRLHNDINGINNKMMKHNNKGSANYRVFKNQASKPEVKPEKGK